MRATGGAGQGRAWVGIAANAGSGRGKGRGRVEKLAAELDRRGLRTRVAWTVEQRADLVAEASRDADCRCLVAAGGDGTVAALINERPSVPVAVLAAGTENLFARHFRFPKRPEAVAETIAAGRLARIDLGLAAGRRFSLMAGLGFDADVVTRHHLARVGRAGVMRPTRRVAYVEPVLRSSFGYRFPSLTLAVTERGRTETLVGTTAFVFNLPRYALGLPFAPTALEDDGLLDVVVFRDPGALQALRYLGLVFLGLHLRQPGVYHRRAERVEILAAGPVPVQLDGDPGGAVAGSPWTAEVLPGALEVLVPPTYSTGTGAA